MNTLIFTDGACLGNPGPGGYAALIIVGAEEQTISGGNPDTTNNRMEMTAAIRALEMLPVGTSGTLHSDSQLLIRGMNDWLAGWKRKGWKNAAKQPIANRDLWEALDALNSRLSIEWLWVKGHAGHPENERVDELANGEAEKVAEEIGWTAGSRFGFQRVA